MQRSKRRKLARLAAGKVATKAKAVRVYPFLTESEAKDRGGFTTTVQALGPLFNRAEARKLGLPLR